MELKPSDMIAVPIETFLPGVEINVDMYIALNEEKVIMIFRAGSPLDRARIKEYHDRKLKFLHIRKEDYSKFMDRQLSVAGILVNYRKAPADLKTTFLNSVCELVQSHLEAFGFNNENFEAAKQVAGSVIHLLNSEPALFKLLNKLNSTSDLVLRHSMSTGFIASMLGRSLGWTRSETLEKLALGGILHDIGKQELSPDLLLKTRADMSYEEMKEYESHPYRGMQILQTLSVVPGDIISIVYEHHENSIGQGFPRRLWDMKINPLGRVVALSNTFSELVMPTQPGVPAKTAEEAIFHIEKVMAQPFNKDAFKNLRNMVGELKKVGPKAS